MILTAPAPLYWSPGLGQTTQQIEDQIVATANAKGVPPSIALALAQHESGFIPTAQNPSSSAAGLFQLMAVTQQTLGVTNPYDPTQNMNAALGLLSSYYQQYGSWTTALEAYSDGPGAVANPNYSPSAQTQGLLSYINAYSVPAGIDLSSDASSSTFDWTDPSTWTLPDLSLPDLSADSLIPGVPDWMTWSGIALVGGALIASVVNRA